ncbi:hypothetical protein BCY91_05285 [Pelobium manganitolerans]|uniref:Uncharacterized protein n=1 Tax=Pelobium manganitolerans TaxID=1842495 RepID=A0A419S623_9SPHI|nr:hypothetical protein [Pelobium manganitolerans]RKD16285.1 hypothetical protein BCY91_05285 [Pelobium manganitolerans]
MKNIGTIILVIGILIVVGSIVLTNAHSFNPADSSSGTHAAAGWFFGGLAVFGVGVVMLANSLPDYRQRNNRG